VGLRTPLQGYYSASSGNLLPTFRDKLSVPPSEFEDRTDRLSRNVGKKSLLLAHNNTENSSSQLLCGGSFKLRKCGFVTKVKDSGVKLKKGLGLL
jgi:hypothetical protein